VMLFNRNSIPPALGQHCSRSDDRNRRPSKSESTLSWKSEKSVTATVCSPRVNRVIGTSGRRSTMLSRGLRVRCRRTRESISGPAHADLRRAFPITPRICECAQNGHRGEACSRTGKCSAIPE
jgi:hypothetical protein